LARAPAGRQRGERRCPSILQRGIAAPRLRSFPERPATRPAQARRFDEKKAADRIAVCS
jgi:hypothetical protein